jgi:FkbM family methyltransferase
MINRQILKSFVPTAVLRAKRRISGLVTFRDQVARYLPQAPVILEAGANDGTDTLELSLSWPLGQVYAIEPIPESFSALVSRTRFRSNVHWSQVALADRTELRQMFVSDNSGQSSSLMKPAAHKAAFPGIQFPTTTSVLAQSLEEWAAQNSVDHIDLMWLDMQGYEPPVLMSSERLLRTVRVIRTEVNLQELYEGCILYGPYRQFLEDQGFVVLLEQLRGSVWGDVTFVRRGL